MSLTDTNCNLIKFLIADLQDRNSNLFMGVTN